MDTPDDTAGAPAPLMTTPGNEGIRNDVSTDIPVREPVVVGQAAPGLEEVPSQDAPAGGAPQPVADLQGQVEQLFPRGDAAGQPAQSDDDWIQRLQAKRSAAAAQSLADSQFLDWKSKNAGVSPDQALEVLRLSDAAGLPPEYVAKNLEVVRKRFGDQPADWQGIAQRAPVLKDWLGAQGYLPAAAKDDLPALEVLQRAVTDPWHAAVDFATDTGRALLHVPEAFTDAMYQQAQVVSQNQDFAGLGSEKNDALIKNIDEQHGGVKDYGVHGYVGKAILGVPKVLPMVVGDLVFQALGGAAGGAVGQALGGGAAVAEEVAGGGPIDPAADVGAGASLALGKGLGEAAGEKLGSGVFNALETLGPTWYRLKGLRDANGQPLDPTVARIGAGVAATANGAVMALSGGRLGEALSSRLGDFLGKVPGGKAVLARASVDAIADSLAKSEYLTALNGLALRHGSHVATAALLMGVQGFINGATQEASKGLSGQPFEVRGQAVVDEAKAGFENGFRDMLFASGISTFGDLQTARALSAAPEAPAPSPEQAAATRDVLEVKGRRAASEQSAQALRDLVDAAQASTTQKGAPAHVADLLRKAAAQQGGRGHAYVDKGAWDRLFQGEKDPADAAREIVGDDGSAYAQASTTGDAIAVPLDRLAKLAAEQPEKAKALLDEARLSNDEDSPREMRDSDKAIQGRAAELAKLPRDEMNDEMGIVYDDYRAKAEGAGSSPRVADANARLVASALQSWADRFRQSGSKLHAWSIYAMQDVALWGAGGRGIGLQEDPFAVPLEDPEHAAISETQDEFQQHLDNPGTEVALRRYFEDPVTGLRNQRATELDPEQGGKVLHFGIEGTKFRNDDLEQGGHNKADELLQAVAQHAAAINPKVWRAGGDFAVRVPDEAAGQDFLQELRARLPEQAKGYGVTGAVGDDLVAASTAHGTANEAAEKAGTRAERGKRPFGLPAGQDAGTTIPAEKVKAELGPEHRQHFADLTSTEAGREQAFREIHVEKGTGILTKQGFLARPPQPYRASIDLNGLKKLNLAVSKEFGNWLLNHFGKLAAERGGLDFDFAHDHGDEYLAQGPSEESLKGFLGELFEAAKSAEVRTPGEKNGATGTHIYKGLLFGYGTGEASNERLAEQRLNAHKLKLSERGLRGNEDQPGRLDFVPDARAGGQGGALGSGGEDRGSGNDAGPGEGRAGAGGGGTSEVGEAGAPGEAPGEGGAVGEGRGSGPGGGDGAAGAGVQGGAGGEPAGAGDLHVAPEVALPRNFIVPTEDAMAAAEAKASTLRSPERRQATQRFLQYVRDYLAGKDASFKLAELPRDLEHFLANKLGITDPRYGYRTKEDLLRAKQGIKLSRGPESARDRAVAADRRAEFEKYAGPNDQLGQPNFRLESKRGRGWIDFTAAEGGKRRRFDINVLSGADNSTLAHETGHFLSEVLGDLAQHPEAPQDLKDDYQGLLKFMGYDSHEQRQAERGERGALNRKVKAGTASTEDQARLQHLTAKEERFAVGWEQYLAEGKTPSAGLARVFARFRTWMVRIYRNVSALQEGFRKSHGEELGFNDDVRRIFDRILASSDEVEKMRAAQAAQPFPELFADAPPAEREAYQRAKADELEAAKTATVRAVAHAVKAENNAEFTEARDRFREETEAKLNANPTYRALGYLQKGEFPGGEELPPQLKGTAYKLDRAALVREYGAEFVKTMPRGIFAPKGEKGLSSGALADLLGYEQGGDILARALQKTETRSKVIAATVEQRMTDTYGPALLDSAKGLQDEALKGLHRPEAVVAAMMEHRRLAAKIDPARARELPDVDPEILARTARQIVARKTVGELTAGESGAAGYFLRSERSAAERMRKAFLAGKIDRALDESQARLLDMHLWREARDARERLETQRDLLQRATGEAWQAALGKADVAAADPKAGNDHAYRDATNAILEAAGVLPAPGAGVDASALDRLLGKVGQDALGGDVGVLRELMADPRSWRELRPDEAQSVHDAVKSIRHAASSQLSFDIEGKRIDRAEWFANLKDHAEEGKQVPPEANTSSGRGLGERAASSLRGFDAGLTEIAAYVDTLDNGDRNGPAHQVFIDERRAARATKVRLTKDVLEKVRASIEAMPKKLRAGLNDLVPGLSELLPMDERWRGRARAPETRADLFTLFLNWGNGDNRQRIIDGNGWTEDQVGKALQLLKPEEARFLQGLLDTIDSLHPELARVFELRKGLPLGKVEATPIKIGDEIFRGGYFPLRYDPRVSRQGAVQLSDVESQLFPQGYTSPTVYSGHTKERLQTVLAPVSLEFGTVQAHLAQVIQDISMGDWVRRAGSLVLDERFKAVVDKLLGSERTALFMPWLRDIASDASTSTVAAAEGTPGFWRGMGAIARNRYAQAVMSLNLPSMLAHLSDPLAAIGEAQGPFNMAARGLRLPQAYIKTLGAYFGDGRPEHALSQDLAYRDARALDNLREEMGHLKAPTTPGLREVAKVTDTVHHVSTLVRHYLDQFHSRILWQVGYDEGLARGMTQAQAARHGDDLLSKTLPSGDIAERAQILRTKHGLASVVLFYGYANKMWNLWVHAPLARADDAWRGPGATWQSRGSSAFDLTAKWITMGAIAALGAKLAGRGPDDEEHAKEWAFWRVLLEPANTMPLIGPMLEAAIEGRPVSVRSAPEAEVVARTVDRIHHAVKAAMAGEGHDQEVWAAVEGLAGVALGPAGQLQRTAGYLHQRQTGQLPPQGAVDTTKGLVFGPPRGR